MKIFVVSLNCANTRRKHILQEFAKQNIEFEFFDALDGKQAQDKMRLFGFSSPIGSLTPGELGCALSHISLWDHLLKSDAEEIGIFEDDIFLGHDTWKFLLSSNWLPTPTSKQLVKLEKYQDSVFIGRGRRCINGRKLHPLLSDHWGTAGYVIGRDAARAMLDYLALNPLTRPIDHFMFDVYRQLAPKTVWQLNPAICIQEVVYEKKVGLGSDLAAEREIRQAKENLINFNVRDVERKMNRIFKFSYWRKKFNKIINLKRIEFI